MQTSQEAGVFGAFDYCVSPTEDEKVAAEFKWRSTPHDKSAT
jgi:hypothetical protein